jgi:hypothetical protein
MKEFIGKSVLVPSQFRFGEVESVEVVHEGPSVNESFYNLKLVNSDKLVRNVSLADVKETTPVQKQYIQLTLDVLNVHSMAIGDFAAAHSECIDDNKSFANIFVAFCDMLCTVARDAYNECFVDPSKDIP